MILWFAVFIPLQDATTKTTRITIHLMLWITGWEWIYFYFIFRITSVNVYVRVHDCACVKYVCKVFNFLPFFSLFFYCSQFLFYCCLLFVSRYMKSYSPIPNAHIASRDFYSPLPTAYDVSAYVFRILLLSLRID